MHEERGVKRDAASEPADPRRRRRALDVDRSLPALLVDATRLVLVLDIDNTLVHSAPCTAPLDPQLAHLERDVIKFCVPAEPGGIALDYKVKLRTGLADFLASAHAQFDLAVYTHGSEGYAKEILKLIDPSGAYFKGRVVSRTEGESIKRLSLLLKDSDGHRVQHAIVIDDREDVWEDAAKGCVQLVRPFYFFESKTQAPLMPGLPKRFERYVAADPMHDEQLTWTLMSTLQKLLEEMRQLGPGASVTHALHNARSRVLQGVKLVLAGGLILEGDEVHNSPLWRFAEALGATCLREFNAEEVSHVVSGTPTAHTVQSALASARQIEVVSPGWLLDCWYRTERVSEVHYPCEAPVPIAPLSGTALLPVPSVPGVGDGGVGGFGGLLPREALDANGGDARVERTPTELCDPRLLAGTRADLGDAVDQRIAPAHSELLDPRASASAYQPARLANEAAALLGGSDDGAAPPHGARPQCARQVLAQAPPVPGAPRARAPADPRRRGPMADAATKAEPARAGAQHPARRIETPPAMPLHELEARFDNELRECVAPTKQDELMMQIALARDPRESARVRDNALSRIVKMVGEGALEGILDTLGFYKPSRDEFGGSEPKATRAQ